MSRGVRNFGLPVALFSTTMVFLTTQQKIWRDMLSLKYLLTVVTAVAVGTVLGARVTRGQTAVIVGPRPMSARTPFNWRVRLAFMSLQSSAPHIRIN